MRHTFNYVPKQPDLKLEIGYNNADLVASRQSQRFLQLCMRVYIYQANCDIEGINCLVSNSHAFLHDLDRISAYTNSANRYGFSRRSQNLLQRINILRLRYCPFSTNQNPFLFRPLTARH